MHVDIWALCWLALCTRYRKTNFFLLAIHLRNHTGKKSRKPPQIEGSGYAVKSLEAALWAFHHTDSFREGCLLAVNLGDDADTTGAIFGQLAGAFYGAEDLPVSWRQKLAHRDLIKSFAQQLCLFASCIKRRDCAPFSLNCSNTVCNRLLGSVRGPIATVSPERMSRQLFGVSS